MYLPQCVLRRCAGRQQACWLDLFRASRRIRWPRRFRSGRRRVGARGLWRQWKPVSRPHFPCSACLRPCTRRVPADANNHQSGTARARQLWALPRERAVSRICRSVAALRRACRIHAAPGAFRRRQPDRYPGDGAPLRALAGRGRRAPARRGPLRTAQSSSRSSFRSCCRPSAQNPHCGRRATASRRAAIQQAALRRGGGRWHRRPGFRQSTDSTVALGATRRNYCGPTSWNTQVRAFSPRGCHQAVGGRPSVLRS